MSTAGGSRNGVVASFDDGVGLGTIVADDGTKFRFHCIEIADGSRTIDVGSAVTFAVIARFGVWQAAAITAE